MKMAILLIIFASGLIWWDTKNFMYAVKMMFFGFIVLLFAFFLVTCAKQQAKLCERSPYQLGCPK